MARRPRSMSTTGWHHVMNRGVDREPIFLDHEGRVDFGRLLGVASDRHGVEVHAYCLMSNHFHLLIRSPDTPVSEFMRDLCTPFSRHVNDRHGRDGHLFRGRFHSVPVESDGQLLMTMRYIHRNPLAIVGADGLESFRWSSHRTYLRYRRPPFWLHLDVLMSQFDDDIARYRAFVHDDRVSATTTDIAPLIELVANCTVSEPPVSASFCRAVAVALLDVVPPRRAGDVETVIAAPSTEALTMLRSRVRQRRRTNPTIDTVAASVADALAA